MVGEVRDGFRASDSLPSGYVRPSPGEYGSGGELPGPRARDDTTAIDQCRIGVSCAWRHDPVRDCIDTGAHADELGGSGAQSQRLEAYDHPSRTGAPVCRVDIGNAEPWVDEAFAESGHGGGVIGRSGRAVVLLER